MALLDLLGRRWTLRVLWELRNGPLTARALRGACDDASPTVLQARLKELRDGGLVDHAAGSGYALTAAGGELLTAFSPLYDFAEQWAKGGATGTGPRESDTAEAESSEA
jgi:DNA-binding HxlR family transcriptional regulator